MRKNNGWISVFDSEKPASGEEVLALEYSGYLPLNDEPFADPYDRAYCLCTWYEPGDTYFNEIPESPFSRFLGEGGVTVEEAGFYVCEPDGPRSAMTWRRLKLSADGVTDGIACWKHLDYPTIDNV